MTAPRPFNEAARLDALNSYHVLDTVPEPGFDDLVSLAAQICDAPLAAVSLLDANRQWFKASIGINVCETPRDIAFCAHGLIAAGDLFIVPDAERDSHFAQNPLVTGAPFIRFYAGARLVNRDGFALGMLCVMDHKVRELSAAQKDSLLLLARQVVAQLELRRELLDHKASRLQLEKSRSRLDELHAIVQQSPAVAFLARVEESCPVEFLTENVSQWGYTPEDFLSSKVTYSSVVHPDDFARVMEQAMAYVKRGEDKFRQEYRIFTRSGQVRWVSDRTSVRRNNEGIATHFEGILLDITARKEAELTARKLAKRHSFVVNNLKEVVFQTDAAGCWTFLNPAWSEITGFKVNESLGTNFLDYVHPDDRRRNQELFAPLIERKKDYCRHEVRYVTKANSFCWVEVFARLTLDELGNVIGTAGTLHDITQRKRAEEKLRQSEALYQSLVGHLPLFILRKDTEGRFIFANRHLALALRCTSAALIGKTDYELVPTETADRLRKTDQTVMATGKAIECIEEIPQPGGPKLHMQMITSPLYDIHSEIVGVQVISMDVSERHRLEMELRQAKEELEDRVQQRTVELENTNRSLKEAERVASEWRERYELIVAASGLAIYDIDCATGRVIWGNGAGTILGRPVQALDRSRSDWLELVHPDDRDEVLRSTDGRSAAGFSFDLEYRFRNGAGEYLWISDRGFFVRDSRDARVRVLGMMQDITQRKVAENKMREQATLLDKTHDAVMVRDLENRVRYWNQAAQRLYGWTTSEVIGQPIHQLLLRGNVEHLPEAISACLSGGEWSGEVKVYTKTGKQLTIHSRWTLLRDRDGEPQAFLVVHTDLTERKLLEEKFMRAQRLESIGALASGIAHDLNNVFTPILMTSQLLERELDAATRGNMLGHLHASARRGSDMVRQVLTFTRGLENRTGPVQLKHLIGELEKMMRDTFPRNIRVQTDLPRDLWAVPADATQLYQVFMNLCINARDAMPEGGILAIEGRNLTIEATRDTDGSPRKAGPYVRITVRDTGMGMTPEVQRRIFEPFFTTKEVGKGTGLGLSTVRSIVAAHSGFMELESTAGSGTSFKIFLLADDSTGGETEVIAAEPPEGCGEMLLVVDDESAIREVLKATLEAYGYDVLLASEGTEAVALYAVNKDKIAMVITDMVMPFMDGYATIRALRKLNPDVKLLAVTGAIEKERLAAFAESEAIFTLPKPYSPRNLLAIIHTALNPDTHYRHYSDSQK